MKDLTVDIKENATGVFMVTLKGPIDTYTHETLEFYIKKILVPTTHTIILDMSKVDYMTSMGIGSIFKIRKAGREHDFQLRMIGVQKQVQKVMDAVQAMPIDSIFSSIEELDEYLDELQKKNKQDS